MPFHSLLSAANINTTGVNLQTETNKHLAGTAYRHLLAEIDTPLLDETITPVALSTAATDLNTWALRIQQVLAGLLGGTGNMYARVAALPAGADLTTIASQISAHHSDAFASSFAFRDTNRGFSVGYLTVPMAAAVAGLAITGAASQTANYLGIVDSAAANVFTIAASKAVTIAGATTFAASVAVGTTLAVTGASTFAAVAATTGAFSGAVTMATTLAVTGASTFAAVSATTVAASGNTTVGGTLAVTGASTLAGLTATTFAASGTAAITGNVTVGGTLIVSGASTFAAVAATTIAASGNTTVGGTLSVTGASTFAAVTATSLASGTLATTGNATIGGTLGVAGASTFAGVTMTSLTASGAAALNGNATVGGTFGVTGATTLAGVSATSGAFSAAVTIATTLSVTGTSTHTGAASFGGGISVSGGTSALAAVTATTGGFSSSVTVGGTLGVTGAATFAGVSATTLAVSGLVSLTGGGLALAVTNNATVGGTFAVAGTASFAAVLATNVTLSGVLVAGSGAKQITTAAGFVDATMLSGVVPVTNGGLGVSSYTANALFGASAAGTALRQINPGTDGQLLTMVSGIPAWATLSSTLADYSVTLTKVAGGALIPVGGNMSITIGATNALAVDGTFVQYPGETLDLTGYRPGTPGNALYILVYLNGQGLMRVAQGVEAASPTKPLVPDTATSLGYVRLSYNQTVVTSANITDARVDYNPFITLSSANGVFAPIAHIHGQAGTAFVPYTGLDEGLVTTPAVAGLSIVVYPATYTDSSGVTRRSLQQAPPLGTLPVTNPRWDVVALTNAGAAYILQGVESALSMSTAPRPAPTNTSDIVLAYIYNRPSATKTVLSDDNVSCLIVEGRRFLSVNQPAAAGLSNVAGGGTGSTSFTAGLIYSTGASSGTAPLQSLAATIASSGTLAFGMTPSLTISPAGNNSDLFSFGGTFVTGGTGGVTLRVLHGLAPTLSGGGTWTNVRTLQLETPAFGTNPRSLYSVGIAEFVTSVIAPTIGPNATQQHALPAVASDTVALIGATQTLSLKTLAAPVLSGTVTGTYTLGGTPTISGAAISGGSLAGTISGTPTFSGAITFSGGVTIGAIAGIVFATAGVISAVNVTSGLPLIAGGTGVPTGLPVSGADLFLISTGANAVAMRTATQARTSLGLVWPFSSARIGSPVNNEEVDRFGVPFAMTLPANLAGAVARSETVCTSATNIDVQRSAAGGAFASIGTIQFANGAKVATFSTTGSATVALAADDRIKLVGPAAWNGLTNLTIDFWATW